MDERPEPVEEKSGLDENTIELLFDAAVDDRADDDKDEEEKVADERLEADTDE